MTTYRVEEECWWECYNSQLPEEQPMKYRRYECRYIDLSDSDHPEGWDAMTEDGKVQFLYNKGDIFKFYDEWFIPETFWDEPWGHECTDEKNVVLSVRKLEES